MPQLQPHARPCVGFVDMSSCTNSGNNWQIGGQQGGTTGIAGVDAQLGTWNPAPVWGFSNLYALTNIDQTHYAQVGEMHIGTGDGTDQFFTEYCDGCSISTRDFWGVVPAGPLDYQVWRDWRDGGFAAQFNGQTVFLSATFDPTHIMTYAEVQLYEPGSSTKGDAGIGDKSNFIHVNAVKWIDSSYVAHTANLGWDNRTATPYQNYGMVTGQFDHWWTWDSRCG